MRVKQNNSAGELMVQFLTGITKWRPEWNRKDGWFAFTATSIYHLFWGILHLSVELSLVIDLFWCRPFSSDEVLC